jgi:hypothetical protein
MKEYQPKIKTMLDHVGDMIDEVKKIPPEHRSDKLLAALDGIMHCHRGMDKELGLRDLICERLTQQVNSLSLLLNQAVPRCPLEPSKN